MTSCVHEFFFCRTSEGCVQRTYRHSVLQDQSAVWSHYTTVSAVSNLFLYSNFYMFNANKCLAISLSFSRMVNTKFKFVFLLVTHFYDNTRWNYNMKLNNIQQMFAHLTLLLALSSHPGSKYSMWKSCFPQGYDRRDILYVLFCGTFVVKIYFVCSFTYIFLPHILCILD